MPPINPRFYKPPSKSTATSTTGAKKVTSTLTRSTGSAATSAKKTSSAPAAKPPAAQPKPQSSQPQQQSGGGGGSASGGGGGVKKPASASRSSQKRQSPAEQAPRAVIPPAPTAGLQGGVPGGFTGNVPSGVLGKPHGLPVQEETPPFGGPGVVSVDPSSPTYLDLVTQRGWDPTSGQIPAGVFAPAAPPGTPPYWLGSGQLIADPAQLAEAQSALRASMGLEGGDAWQRFLQQNYAWDPARGYVQRGGGGGGMGDYQAPFESPYFWDRGYVYQDPDTGIRTGVDMQGNPKIQGGYIWVNPGENLTQIANQAGVSVEEIARYNGIENPNMIRAGAWLAIPGAQQAPGGVPGYIAGASSAPQGGGPIGDPYSTDRNGDVHVYANQPIEERFKYWFDTYPGITYEDLPEDIKYLATQGFSQPDGPGTAVWQMHGNYMRYDDPEMGGLGWGAPDNPNTARVLFGGAYGMSPSYADLMAAGYFGYGGEGWKAQSLYDTYGPAGLASMPGGSGGGGGGGSGGGGGGGGGENAYLNTLNAFLPTLSPEDQALLTQNIYAQNPDEYGQFAPGAYTPTNPAARGYEDYYNRSQAQRYMPAIETVTNPQAKAWLQQIAQQLATYWPQQGSMSTQSALALATALDPLLAQGEAGALAPYLSLAQMMARPTMTGVAPPYTLSQLPNQPAAYNFYPPSPALYY